MITHYFCCVKFEFVTREEEKIIKTFGYSTERDIEARDRLFSLRKNSNPEDLVKEIKNIAIHKHILFFGPGPNLTTHLTRISNQLHAFRQKLFIVAADGSANGLKIINILPDLIVTDLDGISYQQMAEYLRNEVIFLVHGHGDNLEKIQEYSKLIEDSEKIICTTQSLSRYPVINPGGFTDGDRGLYFLHHISPLEKEFWLFGYSFGDWIGSFSKKENFTAMPMTKIKKTKLNYAKDLIDALKFNEKRPIIYYGMNPFDDLKLKHIFFI